MQMSSCRLFPKLSISTSRLYQLILVVTTDSIGLDVLCQKFQHIEMGFVQLVSRPLGGIAVYFLLILFLKFSPLLPIFLVVVFGATHYLHRHLLRKAE